jgi:hypothetical protein
MVQHQSGGRSVVRYEFGRGFCPRAWNSCVIDGLLDKFLFPGFSWLRAEVCVFLKKSRKCSIQSWYRQVILYLRALTWRRPAFFWTSSGRLILDRIFRMPGCHGVIGHVLNNGFLLAKSSLSLYSYHHAKARLLS